MKTRFKWTICLLTVILIASLLIPSAALASGFPPMDKFIIDASLDVINVNNPDLNTSKIFLGWCSETLGGSSFVYPYLYSEIYRQLSITLIDQATITIPGGTDRSAIPAYINSNYPTLSLTSTEMNQCLQVLNIVDDMVNGTQSIAISWKLFHYSYSIQVRSTTTGLLVDDPNIDCFYKEYNYTIMQNTTFGSAPNYNMTHYAEMSMPFNNSIYWLAFGAFQVWLNDHVSGQTPELHKGQYDCSETCLVCGGYVANHGTHALDHYIINPSNTGQHCQICICGISIGSPANHTFSDNDWVSYGSGGEERFCRVCRLPATRQTRAHNIVYDAWRPVGTAQTCGIRTGDCSHPTCSYSYLQRDTTHSYGSWICVDYTWHKHVCSFCEYEYYEKHNMVYIGYGMYQCTVCKWARPA